MNETLLLVAVVGVLFLLALCYTPLWLQKRKIRQFYNAVEHAYLCSQPAIAQVNTPRFKRLTQLSVHLRLNLEPVNGALKSTLELEKIFSRINRGLNIAKEILDELHRCEYVLESNQENSDLAAFELAIDKASKMAQEYNEEYNRG